MVCLVANLSILGCLFEPQSGCEVKDVYGAKCSGGIGVGVQYPVSEASRTTDITFCEKEAGKSLIRESLILYLISPGYNLTQCHCSHFES